MCYETSLALQASMLELIALKYTNPLMNKRGVNTANGFIEAQQKLTYGGITTRPDLYYPLEQSPYNLYLNTCRYIYTCKIHYSPKSII